MSAATLSEFPRTTLFSLPNALANVTILRAYGAFPSGVLYSACVLESWLPGASEVRGPSWRGLLAHVMVKQKEARRFFGLAPMDGLLSAVTEAMPDAVLSGEGEQRIAHRAAQLPECGLKSTFGFESRLDDEAPYCDLFLCAQANSEFSRYLIGSGQCPGARPAQRGLSRFLAELADPSSPLCEWFGTSILEYDLVASHAGAARDPGVFIEPRSEDSQPETRLVMRAHTPLTCGIDLVGSSICLAAGRETDARESAAMAQVAGALPSQGELLHVGAMPSRSPRAVRMVFRLPRAEVIAFFERVRWRGSFVHLRELVDFSSSLQHSESICVACDVLRGALATRVGFELFLKEAWMDARARQWAPVFRALVEKGWCNPAKALALLSWPKRDTLVSERGILSLLTGVNHLKIVLQDEQIRSKAYMGAFLFPQ